MTGPDGGGELKEEKPFKVAVLISGGGTTLRNLIARRDQGELKPVELALVISSNQLAAGNGIAEAAGIPLLVLDYREFRTPEAISRPLFEACRNRQIDLVVMGGFLRKVEVPADFEKRVVNIHPGLIPAFCGQGMYGMRVHQAVVDSGVKQTGCTVHFVDNFYDHGEIIASRTVEVRPGDDARAVAARVFEAECSLYPSVILELARRRNRAAR